MEEFLLLATCWLKNDHKRTVQLEAHIFSGTLVIIKFLFNNLQILLTLRLFKLPVPAVEYVLNNTYHTAKRHTQHSRLNFRW